MRRNKSLLTGLIASLIVCLFIPGTFAQSPRYKKKKLKDFGSSLKRLKWDPQKNAAVAIDRPGAQTATSNEEDVVRIETSLVTSELLVLDRQGRNVPGLTADDFVIGEDGEPQQVGHFLLGDNVSVPRTIVLIIDYSGSQAPYLRSSIDAAKVLVDKLGPYDLMAIVNDDVDLILDFTGDKKKLKNRLESLVERARGGAFGEGARRGRSMQYSALMATLNEAFEEQDVRPIVVFQTDGDEAYFLRNPVITPSIPPNLPPDMQTETQQDVDRIQQQIKEKVREFSLDDVYRTAEKSRATIYTVIPGTRLLGFSPDEQGERIRAEHSRIMEETLLHLPIQLPKEKRDELKARQEERSRRIPLSIWKWRAEGTFKQQSALAAVATLTGGWTEFLERPAQAQEIYSRIFSDINQRYIVGYYPTNKEHDGKRRKVSFEVKGHPDYVILGRKSYFAPAPSRP